MVIYASLRLLSSVYVSVVTTLGFVVTVALTKLWLSTCVSWLTVVRFSVQVALLVVSSLVVSVNV